MVLKPLNIKVDVLGYGPFANIDNKEITPEQLIAFSATMTYKDKSAKDIIAEVLKSEKNIDEVATKSLRNSVRRGHASLSTSAAMWCLFNGTSKYLDSLFTGAVFSSSLMPSSRRIPVNLENIIAPDSIINADDATKKIYEEAASNNIKFYMEIENKSIPREEAAKITQYGIAGGGFILLPLETILSAKNEFISQGKWTPKEAFDIIKRIEKKIGEIKADTLYKYREEADKSTYPHLNIFKEPDQYSEVEENRLKYGPSIKPSVQLKYFDDHVGLENKLKKLYSLKEEITQSPEIVRQRVKELLIARNKILSNYINPLTISSLSNPSWRVWGEVKRHRTLKQSVGSIYTSVERSYEKINNYRNEIKNGDLSEVLIKEVDSVFMIPKSFLKNGNSQLLQKYMQLFMESLDAYNTLVSRGIPESDALALIPRGIRCNVYKTFDLYNLLEGYIPLRCCSTAESEMREITEMEIAEIKKVLPEYITKHLGPKCAGVGHCLEPKVCSELKVQNYIGYKYDGEVHRNYFS
ncbi:MAG: FAD-dependent thymidylate synthase [Nanoarchaeota archaeon]